MIDAELLTFYRSLLTKERWLHTQYGGIIVVVLSNQMDGQNVSV